MERGDNKSSGFPGSWLVVVDKNLKNLTSAQEKRNAAVLRVLRQVAGILSKEFPKERLAGTIVLSDIPVTDSSAEVNRDDSELEVLINISSDILWIPAERQKTVINESLKIERLSRLKNRFQNKNQPPLIFSESGQRRRLVQFLTVGSMFEGRESDLCCVPPAAFYLAQPLLDKGFEISVDSIESETFSSDLDFKFYAEKSASRLKLSRIIKEKKPFCIAITAMDLYLDQLRGLLKYIRKIDKEVFIAVGGPLVTFYPERAAVHLPEANIFIRGEADFVFSDVLSDLGNLCCNKVPLGKALHVFKSYKGLFLNIENTTIISSLDQKNKVNNLEDIFVGKKIDLSFVKKRHISNGIFLNTSRGCPFHCKFCSKVHGKSIRQLSAETIIRVLKAFAERIDEIDKIEKLTAYEKSKAFSLFITDDDFFLNPTRAVELFKQIKDLPFVLRGVPGSLPSFLGPGRRDERTINSFLIDAMKTINNKNFMLELGTDDFSESELSRLGKGGKDGYSLREIENVISYLDTTAIANRHFVILSNPYTSWSDLFNKIITIEEFSWRYRHFEPWPNPVVLATEGTPLFFEIAELGMNERLKKRKFQVEGFGEFDHSVLNLVIPDEDIFSSDRLPCLKFFKLLSDLLKTKYRFSIFNESYLQFFYRYKNQQEGELSYEKERVYKQIFRAVTLRMNRIFSIMNAPFYFEAGKELNERINIFLNYILGAFFICESISTIFPENVFEKETHTLRHKYPVGLFYKIISTLMNDTRIALGVRKPLGELFYSGVEQIKSILKTDVFCKKSVISSSFIEKIGKRLSEIGLSGKANKWIESASNCENLIDLKQNPDVQFVIDSEMIDFLFEMIVTAEPRFLDLRKNIVFLKAETVLAKSIKEDFIPYSKVNIPLYNKWLSVDPEFKSKYYKEVTADSGFLHDEEFISAVLSRYLACRFIEHDSEIFGTKIFDEYEDFFKSIVPQSIYNFSEWFFNSDNNKKKSIAS